MSKPSRVDRTLLSDRLVGLAVFVVALVPRALALNAFVTVDEAKWVYRSARFLAALLQGDLAGTVVNLTPAVTTTWLASIGLVAYHALAKPGPALVDWLLSLPQYRTDLDVLVATRWPMVLLTSLGVLGFYHLARRLTDHPTAVVFGLLLALDPHFISLSRVLGHDAPAGMFVGLSLLAWLAVMKRKRVGLLLFSAVCAGLALLSKSPAFFLVPFVGLVWLVTWLRRRPPFGGWAVRLLVWSAVVMVVFILFWPAAWQQPLLTPWSVVSNAFASATDVEEAAAESFWRVPDLGALYYPVNAAFKLSLAASLGLVAWLVLVLTRRGRKTRAVDWGVDGWLLAFALLFIVFMTLGGKRSSRYLLPAWPALYLLAAVGFRHLPKLLFSQTSEVGRKTSEVSRDGKVRRQVLAAVLGLVFVVPLIYTFPYYLSYYNPLVGGPWTAQRLVKIGWGEGLDRVGRWLEAQPNALALRVGSEHGSAVAPFFSGDISDVTGDALDYVVLYVKQVQAGEPSPSILRYYQSQTPAHTVSLAGIEYARIMRGPAVVPALATSAAFDTGILPKPLAFRLDRLYLPIGGEVQVDVVWLAEDVLPTASSRLSLVPLDNLEAVPEKRSGFEFASAESPLARGGDEQVLSRFKLAVPADLPRDDYGLLVDGRPLGKVTARQLDVPALPDTPAVTFGGQLELSGVAVDVAANRVTLAWRAAPRVWHDYTAFMHVLDAGGNRVGGVDGQPSLPASRLGSGEVLVMTYAEGGPYGAVLPSDLPAGEYRLAVGWYAPDTQQRLTLPDGADVFVLPDVVRVE